MAFPPIRPTRPVDSGARDAASFRDRWSYVYEQDRRIFRHLEPEAISNWEQFHASGLAAALIADGLLVETRRDSNDRALLEHARLQFVSYAYEWPFTLLQRAALLHLQLLERLIPAGLTLQDATPSNVMFEGVRPVFIDVASIVPHTPGKPWVALRQFFETMLYPLLLSAHKGVPHQRWLRGAGENGITCSQLTRLFGWRDVFRPGVLAYVKLYAALERLTDQSPERVQSKVDQSALSPRTLLRTISRLKNVITNLRPAAARAVWTGYTGESSYTPQEMSAKREAIVTLLGRLLPTGGTVWDIGCNRGDYSVLAAESAGLVVAIDEDPAVVDLLSQRCIDQRVTNVLPLVVDFANPSPAQGWRGTERRSLVSRAPADVVLGLGLLHHLVLSKNLPVADVLGELSRFAPRCVLEFIAPDDKMARQLQTNLAPNRNRLSSLVEFETMVRETFDVEQQIALSPTRRLFALAARTAA